MTVAPAALVLGPYLSPPEVVLGELRPLAVWLGRWSNRLVDGNPSGSERGTPSSFRLSSCCVRTLRWVSIEPNRLVVHSPKITDTVLAIGSCARTVRPFWGDKRWRYFAVSPGSGRALARTSRQIADHGH